MCGYVCVGVGGGGGGGVVNERLYQLHTKNTAKILDSSSIILIFYRVSLMADLQPYRLKSQTVSVMAISSRVHAMQ